MEFEKTENKIDIKNIALKAPTKSKTNSENIFWGIFWISDVPKRNKIGSIRKEYEKIMETMKTSESTQIVS